MFSRKASIHHKFLSRVGIIGLALCFNAIQGVWANASAETKTFKCIPAINIVIDMGYCFGFFSSYYQAIDDRSTLEQIGAGGVEENIRVAHEQCYQTDFNQQKTLGQLGFGSYINLKDDSLLRKSANHCNILMEYYAKQNTANTSLSPSGGN